MVKRRRLVNFTCDALEVGDWGWLLESELVDTTFGGQVGLGDGYLLELRDQGEGYPLVYTVDGRLVGFEELGRAEVLAA